MKYLILLLLASFIQPCFAGDDPGGGGDTYAKEFEMLGRALHKTFAAHPEHPLLVKWNLKPSLFEMAINTTLLRSADGTEVILDGMEVDAINHYHNQIVIMINQDRWIEKSLLKKLELVLHEYLGILGVEKNNYPVTNEFADLVIETYNRIKNTVAQDVNLYFGKQKVTAPMSSASICDATSTTYKDAVEVASYEAISKCQLYNKKCSIISVEGVAVISSTMIGYKYCSITAIAH
jgi:hypothetical protein